MPEIGSAPLADLTKSSFARCSESQPTTVRMYARRHGWPHRTPNMYGDRARVLVPDDVDVRPRPALFGERSGHATSRDQADSNGRDQANVQVFGSAISALSEALTAERERVTRAEQQTDQLADANRPTADRACRRPCSGADQRRRGRRSLSPARPSARPSPVVAAVVPVRAVIASEVGRLAASVAQQAEVRHIRVSQPRRWPKIL
jgi:hypothetical protein